LRKNRNFGGRERAVKEGSKKRREVKRESRDWL